MKQKANFFPATSHNRKRKLSKKTCQLRSVSRGKVYKARLKFIYSEKARNFFEIFTLLLSFVVPVKSKVKISQNFVAFSEYMNFKNSTF